MTESRVEHNIMYYSYINNNNNMLYTYRIDIFLRITYIIIHNANTAMVMTNEEWSKVRIPHRQLPILQREYIIKIINYLILHRTSSLITHRY